MRVRKHFSCTAAAPMSLNGYNGCAAFETTSYNDYNGCATSAATFCNDYNGFTAKSIVMVITGDLIEFSNVNLFLR